MAIRKNTKRIDPRYFLNETTTRGLDENVVGLVMGINQAIAKAGGSRDEKPKYYSAEIAKMKITKQQLKQIIKEELDATMDEGLENVTPENIQIAVEAFKQVAMNLAPAVVLPALMMAYKELKMSKKD